MTQPPAESAAGSWATPFSRRRLELELRARVREDLRAREGELAAAAAGAAGPAG